jgi:hypothetical protein
VKVLAAGVSLSDIIMREGIHPETAALPPVCSCVSITLIMPPTRVPQLREDHLGTLEVLRVDGDHADLHQNSAPRGTFICHLVLRKRRNEVPRKQLNGD